MGLCASNKAVPVYSQKILIYTGSSFRCILPTNEMPPCRIICARVSLNKIKIYNHVDNAAY